MHLSLAESLDRSQAGLVQHAWLGTVDVSQVVLYVQTTHDHQVDVWGVQNHVAAFEKVFRRKLNIKVMTKTSD